MRRFVPLMLALLGSAPAWAQPAPTPPTPPTPAAPARELANGDPAPPLSVATYLKGEPVGEFQADHLYVVDFWATWCIPCVAEMPRISALRRTFKEATFIGVNIWEAPTLNNDIAARVESFVKNRGDRIDYTIAYDGPERKTEQAYMKAARVNALPQCFVIKGNTILWHGETRWLEAVLTRVTQGRWESATGPAAIDDARKAIAAIFVQARKDPKSALAAWAAFAREHPDLAAAMPRTEGDLLLIAGDYPGAFKALTARATEALAVKDIATLGEVSRTILAYAEKAAPADLDLALTAAAACVELTARKDLFAILELAEAHAAKRDYLKAIELAREAVASAKDGLFKDQAQEAVREYETRNTK